MAKPLGPKSLRIREAIAQNPDLGNTELAQFITGSDKARAEKIEVKAQDIAQQKQAMKKAGGGSAATPVPTPAAGKPVGNGRRTGGRKRQAAVRPQAAQAAADPLEAARQVKELCDRYGAETVKGLAELFGK
jgi:hypothetical protein